MQTWRARSKTKQEPGVRMEGEMGQRVTVTKTTVLARPSTSGTIKIVPTDHEQMRETKEGNSDRQIGERRASDYKPNYTSEKPFRF